jgi:hypothetical protein
MVCRGGGIWISDDGLSTYRQVSEESVYPKVEGRFEDPVLWRTHIQYHMVVNDWYGRIAYYLRSRDGLEWKVDPGEAYLPGIARYEDGTEEGWFKYERMKVLQDELGRATQAHFAVIDTLKHEDKRLDSHSSKHICIPLTVGRQLEILNREVIDCCIDSIRVLLKAEEGFDPHKDMDFSSLRFGAPEEVNYGFGSQLLEKQESGKDLVLVFEGKGNGLSEGNFTAKLLGRDREGKLLFGYARLPWVDYPDASATVFAVSGHAGYDTIRVEEFGALVNSRQNVTGAVKAALLAAREKDSPLLLFEKGRYDFWPQYSEERVYYESNTSDIPLTAQAEVLEVNDQSMLLKIDREESPFVIEDGKIQFVGEGWKSPLRSIMEIERESRLIAPQTGDPGSCGRGWDWAHWVEEEPGLLRVHKPFGPRRPEVGNYLILRHSYRDHAGMFLYHSMDISIRDVEVYHTAGLGILSQYSENISMFGVKMVPNPQKNRYLSGHDDGFHFSNCRGQITVSGCEFAALMDDPINIHGTSVRVEEILSENRLRCRFKHHQSVGLLWARPGEQVGFIENISLQTIAEGRVAAFKLLSAEEFEISFAEAIPRDLAVGDALENLSWIPDAFIVDNSFMSCRARGILVSTPGKVLIEGNYFESSGSAILIAGDANNWYESGAVKDVTIRNNVFAAPCLTSLYQFSEAVISIYPEIPDPEAAEEKFHRNIRIVDNEFHLYDYPVLYAKSVDGLEFKANRLIRSHRFSPFHPRKVGFSLLSCRNVEISGNSIDEEVLGRNILLEGTEPEELRLASDQDLELITGR